MPRTCTVLFTFALVAAAGSARPLAAQQAEPVAVADSTVRPRQLAAVVITAEKAKASRAGVLALMEENRRLAGVLAAQDRRVTQLAARLHYLQTTVTDSVTREIATLDGAAAEARARRLALEARLAAIEGSTTSASTRLSTP